MAGQGQTDARAVDWSFPMNPSHLPPKSPGSFSSLGAAAGDSSATGRRLGTHKRTPSAGFLPQVQPTWMEGLVDAPSVEGPFKRGTHRRSASESMAFLDGNTNFAKMIDNNNGTEDTDYESQSVASMHSGGHSGAGSVDFDRLDEDQLLCMFGNEKEPEADLPPSHHRNNKAGAAPPAGSDPHAWRSSSKQSAGAAAEPATPSDSNSVASEVSNEDLKGGLGKDKSDLDVQSSGDHDGGVAQTFSKTELQAALAGLDSSLDPKRAKRILANRQSAQRSRVRKLQYISELERSVTSLQSEVSTMAPQVAFFEHRRAVLNVDNNSIKQKMAALLQGQRFKDAHNEALHKEVQRLRQLYQHHQQLQQQPQHLQSHSSALGYDRHHGESSIGAVPDIFASSALAGGTAADTAMASSGSMSPTHSRTRSLPHSLNTMVASTW